jgi:hypothetical protein
MSYEFITVEQKGRVGVITLNRPKQLNALSPGLMAELGSALAARPKSFAPASLLPRKKRDEGAMVPTTERRSKRMQSTSRRGRAHATKKKTATERAWLAGFGEGYAEAWCDLVRGRIDLGDAGSLDLRAIVARAVGGRRDGG